MVQWKKRPKSSCFSKNDKTTKFNDFFGISAQSVIKREVLSPHLLSWVRVKNVTFRPIFIVVKKLKPLFRPPSDAFFLIFLILKNFAKKAEKYGGRAAHYLNIREVFLGFFALPLYAYPVVPANRGPFLGGPKIKIEKDHRAEATSEKSLRKKNRNFKKKTTRVYTLCREWIVKKRWVYFLLKI